MGLIQNLNKFFGGGKRERESEQTRIIQEKMMQERAEKEELARFYISFCKNVNNEPAEIDYSNMTILLVDDFAALLKLHSEAITALGAKCVAVESADEALTLLEKSEIGTFDVILTDINMRPMNGLEFSKKIRMMDRPDVKKLVILAVTVDYPSRIYEAGMNGYLNKPLNTELFHSLLQKYLKIA